MLRSHLGRLWKNTLGVCVANDPYEAGKGETETSLHSNNVPRPAEHTAQKRVPLIGDKGAITRLPQASVVREKLEGANMFPLHVRKQAGFSV